MSLCKDALTPKSLRPRLPEKAKNLTDEQLQARIDDAIALASVYAPCISSATLARPEAAAALIRGAIAYDIGADMNDDTQAEVVGPFQRTRFSPTRSGTLFSPSQIEALKALCPAVTTPGAYSIPVTSTMGGPATVARGDVWRTIT